MIRRPPELVQLFRLKGEFTTSHERKSAACPKFDMAILLAYPSGEEGGYFSFKLFLPADATWRGRGGVGPLWEVTVRKPEKSRNFAPF